MGNLCCLKTHTLKLPENVRNTMNHLFVPYYLCPETIAPISSIAHVSFIPLIVHSSSVPWSWWVLGDIHRNIISIIRAPFRGPSTATAIDRRSLSRGQDLWSVQRRINSPQQNHRPSRWEDEPLGVFELYISSDTERPHWRKPIPTPRFIESGAVSHISVH